MAGLGQFALDVVDGEVAFAHGHDEFAYRVTSGGVTGPMLNRRKEVMLFVGVMAELVAQDAKRARRVAKAACDLMGWAAVDEVGTKGFVLSVQRVFGSKEELGDRR